MQESKNYKPSKLSVSQYVCNLAVSQTIISLAVFGLTYLLITGCANHAKNDGQVIGIYESKNYSKFNIFDKYPGDIGKYSVGNKLKIAANGSCKYETCSNEFCGNWSLQQDTLKLICNFMTTKSLDAKVKNGMPYCVQFYCKWSGFILDGYQCKWRKKNNYIKAQGRFLKTIVTAYYIP
jgi:hypothetical protein